MRPRKPACYNPALSLWERAGYNPALSLWERAGYNFSMRATVERAITRRVIYASIAAMAVAALFYGGYSYYLLDSAYRESESANATVQYEFGILIDKLRASNAQIETMSSLNGDLITVLEARTQEKAAIEQQAQSLSSTVSTLDKLVKTDKQLLEKYSSVYFLNENYVPKDLTALNPVFLNRPEKSEQMIVGILPHFTALLGAAAAEKIPLQILSAYRSYGTQSTLKSAYKVAYGSGTANSFSADQGYSEHQLGTTVDFVSSESGGKVDGFEKTPAYQWLLENAHRFGFELSYPKGNNYYVYEPWHWRFVGAKLAISLYDNKLNFYDVDQREIDVYLVNIFD